jgi:ribosome-associated heat shock protein Hsp15
MTRSRHRCNPANFSSIAHHHAEFDMDAVRLDKWLWAARFFKTRSAATEAVNGGKVELNGLRPKPSKDVKVGDLVRVRIGPFIHAVTVRGLSERRGPAAAAALLFEESEESVQARERLREQHRLAPTAQFDEGGRPTKKDRRAMSAFEERQRRRDR